MACGSQRDCYVEDGLSGSSSEQETPSPPCRLAPRLALGAGLLAVWGALVVVVLNQGPVVAPRVGAVQAEADAPLISFAADGGLEAEEAHPPTEAVGRWGWDPAGEAGCVTVVKGARYWVESRRPTGWTYIYSFDYKSEGWVPDTALYHGKPTIVRKAYNSNGFSVMPGDSVWILDRKASTAGGPDWVYVLFMDKEFWIDESAIHENDIFNPTPCFVKEAFDAQDAAHLTITKGEVVWANVSPDPTAMWLLVENDRKETGWVPRKHLIENRPLPVLQTFNADSKVQTDLPSPLLYVTEGETVWVDHTQTTPGWVYSYKQDKDGFVPEWALMQVLVNGKSEEVTAAEAAESQVPVENAPLTADGGTVTEGAFTEATDVTLAPTPAPTTVASTTTPAPTTTAAPTTPEPTTAEPTTAEPTTAEPTTAEPTTVAPTTAEPVLPEGEPEETTAAPTTAKPTTAAATTAAATTAAATTAEPTSAGTTAEPIETSAEDE